jgi:putative toxin-antitoxin system antitoxin component (TIGR02293 family)
MGTWNPHPIVERTDPVFSLAGEKLVEAVQEGFYFSSFQHVAKAYNVTLEALAASLGIASSTMNRRKKKGVLEMDESDKLASFVQTMRLAEKVLGDKDRVQRWMQRPNPALGSKKPMGLLSTMAGFKEVENTLLAIEHGIFL